MSDSSKRFGSRYGKGIRNKVSDIEKDQKDEHKCPNCGSEKLKRESTGVWKCKKCEEKVAGGAWKPKTGAEKIMEKALKKED